MFWSRNKKSPTPQNAEQMLEAQVQQALGQVEETQVKVVTAVVGLLAVVAYADRKIGADEATHLREQLGRIHDLSKAHVESIAQLLGDQAMHLSATSVPRFTRILRSELPEESRFEVLDALLHMAAADGAITRDEVVSLRNMSTALGLSQEHYNDLQEKHRAKLKW
jgi:uncharacterized tellurite resistance protein B-like protein